MDPLRSADGFGGIVILAIIFFVMSIISKAKQSASTAQREQARGTERGASSAGEEAVSLESILRQIETVKRQKDQSRVVDRSPPRVLPRGAARREVAQDERGPLGRVSRTRLESAEEVEDRTSLEDEGAQAAVRRLRPEAVTPRRGERVTENRADAATVIAQRRIDLAEARNRPHTSTDHAQFDQEIRKPAELVVALPRRPAAGLKEAMIWREILGPPKALEEEG